MDCTQVLDDLYLEDATRYKDGERKQLGYLEIGGIKHAVYNGENFIGRDKSCSISVTSKALSKEHAVIEVIDEDVHLVYDLGSRNKTRIGKMVLQPHVRYQLPDGARLQLADVTAVYQRLPVNLEVDDGSSSETGSESMLTLINMVDKEESSQFNGLDAVIVPETPGPSCTKPKNVVIIQESPNSDMDSSFGMTNTCKTNVSRRDESAGVSVTKDKDFKNHSKVKQDTNDDSVFEAETQCDIDCPDMTKCSANTLHMSSVSHNDEVCASESDQEEDDLFEAETQCEEPSLKVLLKSSNANDSKNRNLALRSETIDAVDDDIYEAITQCVPGDIPNEKIGVNVASKGKLGSKIVNSLEERKVNIGTADRLCKTDRFVPNDMGDSPDEHGGEIYDAPTQYISGNGERTSFMGKTNTFSVCSEQTKECMSSPEGTDIKLSVDRKEDTTDSSTLTEKKGVGSENKVDEAPSSNREDQQNEQTDSDGNSKVSKAALDASFNEDSFDHSMLEGDDDLFTYEGTSVIDSKEATLEVSSTTKTFSKVHSEGSKSESVSTNSNDTHANLVMLSKERTTKPSKSEKTVSGCGAFEKCTSSKSKLVQIQNDAGGKVSVLDAKEQSVVPLMKSLRPTNKETPKLSNGSGDETHPGDIFEVKAEANVSLNRNKKGSTKSFHRSSVKSSSDTVTTISKIKSKLSAQPSKDSGDETDPEDIFEARTQIHVPPVKNSKIVSKHSEPSSSKISREISVSVNSSTQVNIDSGNAEDQDRICETQNQVVESQDEKNRKITNPEDSSKQDSSKSITSKPAVIRTKKVETPTQLSTEFKDNNNNDDDDDDDIFCAPTQILPIPNENIDATKLPVSLRKEMTDSSVKISTQSHSASRDHDGNNDEDDNIYEAETQIAETPNRSSKSLTEISKPASEAEIKDIQAIKSTDRCIQEDVSSSEIKNTKKARATTQLDNAAVVDDGDIFEAPTQILDVPSRSCKDFTEHSKSSPSEAKINAPAVKYGSGVKAPKLIETSSGNENDGILEIGTQKIEVPDGNNKDFPKHSGSSSGKRSYHPSTQVSFGTVDDPEKGIYDAPTQKITDRIFKEIPSDDSTVVGSKIGSKKVSNSGQARQKTDQKILTTILATIKHSSELSIDSSDKTDTADICISVAGKVNSPDTSTSDAKGLNKCELRESCVTEGSKKISENIRPTKVSATPDVQSRCDKWSEIRTQTTAEVIPQKESSEVLEVVVSTTDSTPGLRDSGFDGSKKSVAETGVDSSETVPPDKPIFTQNTQKDCISEMIPTISEEDGVNRSEVITSKKLVISPSIHTADGKSSALLETKTPIDVSEHTQNSDVNEHESKTPDATDSSTKKCRGRKSMKKQFVPLNVQKDGDNETGVDVLGSVTPKTGEHCRKADDTKVTSKKGTVGKSGMAESVIPDTPKPEMREAEEPHGSTLRAEKAGDGKRGMEGLRKPGIPTSGVQKENNEVFGMTESKKPNDSVLGTHRNGRGTSDMNEIKKPGDNVTSDQGCFNGKHLISNSKKFDIKSTQKEDDSKCEGAGSEIPSDDKSSIHDGSGDKTDSENVLEANSQKIQVDRSSELNKVKKSAVPIDSYKNVDKLIDDNLNDTFELIMPSSQDLMKAVKAYEAKQSPFKPEEVVPSEDEEPSNLTLKITRHSHFKSKRAKVRKRPCTKSKASDTTVVGSVKHLPNESSVDVSTISNAAAGTSRRRKLSYEDIDQSDKSDIILQASKQRKLSNKDPLENDSKNKVNYITSRRRSRRCPGEIQQIETEDVLNTDKENGKARKSKIVKGQDEIVASADSQTETNVKLSIETSRREKSLRSGVHRNKKEEQGFKSEQSNKPRKGRRRLKEVVESTEDNDNKDTGKRSVDKKEDVENALATSIRPSIQQKMTCKIRDSLGSDKSEGSPAPEEERSKSRSRGRLSSNSQNEVNEKVELSTHRTLRSRKVSLSKPPSEELLKNSEDFGGNTSKDVKEKKITDSVPGQQNVSLRKSPGQNKGDGAVTSVTDLSKNRSPQKVARQNDIGIVSNRERKRKTEETVTEAASKRSKKAKSQENSADRCSPETSKSVLNTDESFKDLNSDFRTIISGRKERQTANVEAMQEPSTDITNIHAVLKSASSSSIESVQSCTGRSVRRRMAVAVKDTSLSFLNVSGRPQRGVKHAKSADEEHAEHLSAKQTKTEEKLSKTHSPSFENSVQNDEVKCVQSPRRGRTRRKVMSSQKSEITETAKHDTKSGQRERTSRISKTDKTYKELENEPVTPKSRKINLSADQDITPQHARSSRGRGTPQSNIRLSSQKSDSSVSTQRRSTPRRMASAGGTAHHVLFTGFSDSKQEYVVRQLGGRVVDLPESCSVLVTDRVRRTYKFLCIMGRGKPIVSPEWLAQCQRSGCFVDPWKFLIKDHESESKFKFQLRESLEAAARTNLLAGYSVYVTPKVNPPPSEMKGIIESCGGVFMSLGAVKSWPVNSFIISCSDDKASWSKLKKSGKPIVGADILLLGVLQQKLDLKSNTLV